MPIWYFPSLLIFYYESFLIRFFFVIYGGFTAKIWGIGCEIVFQFPINILHNAEKCVILSNEPIPFLLINKYQ